MKSIIFRSQQAGALSHFVALKQLACTDYFSQARLLSYLDSHLLEKGDEQPILTREAVCDYLATLGDLASRSFDNRYCVIRQYSIHLQQIHPNSYVLPKRPYAHRDASRSAYIYTVDEVMRLLNACDFTARQEAVPGLYRTLFSLLYTSGIRIGEALALNIEDFTAEERLLHVRCGKFRKERYLILSRSMTERMVRHLNAVGTLSGDGPMFCNTRKTRLSHNRVSCGFRKTVKEVDILKNGLTGPRIHDFRHTFAVHRLLKWYDMGVDVNTKLPHLSTYMGHVDILSTQVYLHPFEQLIEQGAERFHRFYLNHVTPLQTSLPEISP